MRDLFEKMSCFSPIHSGFPEAVTRKCSVKKVFLEILQNSQENTCTRVSFLVKRRLGHNVFSCELCEMSKNTYSYRTPPVAASWFLNSSHPAFIYMKNLMALALERHLQILIWHRIHNIYLAYLYIDLHSLPLFFLNAFVENIRSSTSDE